MPTIHQSRYTANFLSLHQPNVRSRTDRTNSCFSVLYQFDFGVYRGRLHRNGAWDLLNCLQLYPDRKKRYVRAEAFSRRQMGMKMGIGTIGTITGWVGTALYAHIAYQNSML